jgi:uncharacterized membrane protein
MTPSMSENSGSRPTHRTVRRAVLAMAVVYAVWFSLYTCFAHDRFKTWAFDLGTFDQGIWLAGHGFDYFVTVRGLPLLGDHVRLFSFVLAPLYWIWDDVRALLVMQSVAIAAGAWFLCRIGLRELPGRPWLVLSLCAGYLLNPAVQNLNLDHAHPDAFASTLLLASVDFLRAGRMGAFAAAAALAMSCKEDVPLVFVALGVALMFDRRSRRTGLAIASASVILPYFNEAGFFRYGKTGFLAGLWYQGHDPRWLLERFTRWDSIRYLLEIGLANLYLFLLAPLALLPAVPALVANLVSDAWYMRNLEFHYQTSVVPFLYVATVQALARFDAMRGAAPTAGPSPVPTTAPSPLPSTGGPANAAVSRALSVAVTTAPAMLLAAAVVANLAWSRAPISNPGVVLTTWRQLSLDHGSRRIHTLIERIPKHAVVSADYSTVPHLSHRRFVYMFPNPFVVSNWGVDGEHTHDPESVDYILLRNVHSAENLQETMNRLLADGRFEPIAGDTEATLYRRTRAVVVSDRAGCGDWTGDGKIGEEDVRLIGEAIMKKRDCPLRVCDANGDGQLRSNDVLLLGKRRDDPTVPLHCPP